MFPPTITTERLLLRPPRLDDADVLFERYARDPEATRYLTWAPHRSVEETESFLAELLTDEGLAEQHAWVICVGEDTAPSGMIAAARQGHERSLGYVLSRACWGQGLMAEATRAVTAWLWQDPSVWRISAHAHVDNVGSHRVLEKAGFRREGVLRRAFKIARCGDVPQDAVLFARVRDDHDLAPGQ